MPRLFWKFFTTIWLTMAATVGVIFLLVNFLQGVPFARELEEERRVIALNSPQTCSPEMVKMPPRISCAQVKRRYHLV